MYNQLQRYLQAKGFSAHPFATTNAEEETDDLPSFFIRAAWFDQLVGDPKYPSSTILYAPQGYGKTSHRLEVARIASEPSREHRALVVVLDDVHVLLREPVTIETYIRIIRRKTIDILKKQLSPERLALLKQQDEMTLLRLEAFSRLYTPLQVRSSAEPGEIVAQMMQEYQQNDPGPREWLKEELYPLVKLMGFASVYVLLDGLDESQATRDNTNVALQLLRPLLDAPGLLQGCGFAFKFFLPLSLKQPMQEQHIGRLDRIPQRLLSWSEAQLVDMLSQRLSNYSRVSETSAVGTVNSFRELCDVDFDPDILLAQAAQSSPRKLLDLAREILDLHCTTMDDADSQITGDTIRTVLNRAVPSQTVTDMMTLPADTLAAPAAADARNLAEPDQRTVPPTLFIDERGDIWLGNQRQELDLPKLLRKCIDYLWRNRDHVIRYEDIFQELYGDDLSRRADPWGSCDKLIQRLRKKLEPDSVRSSYIEMQSGVGYVLRNYRDQQEDVAWDISGISAKNP